jgi:hypothetical protein
VTVFTEEGPDWAHSGAVHGMEGKPPKRTLVKARLLPDLHDRLTAYAARTHRSASSAAEHLIALCLDVEGEPEDSLNAQGDQSVTTEPNSAGHRDPQRGRNTRSNVVGPQGLEP